MAKCIVTCPLCNFRFLAVGAEERPDVECPACHFGRCYSGRECTRQVTYIARGGEGVFAELGCLAPGWVCMSIKRMWF